MSILLLQIRLFSKAALSCIVCCNLITRSRMSQSLYMPLYYTVDVISYVCHLSLFIFIFNHHITLRIKSLLTCNGLELNSSIWFYKWNSFVKTLASVHHSTHFFSNPYWNHRLVDSIPLTAGTYMFLYGSSDGICIWIKCNKFYIL